jgi:PAS domain S-box-containing protein
MSRRLSALGNRSVRRSALPELASAVEMESIVHAGNWALAHATMRCRWSPGLFALVDVEPGSVDPAPQTLADYIHPDDREDVLAGLRRSVLLREPYEAVHRIRSTGGLTKIVLQRARTTFGASGEPLQTFGTLVDITGQQRIRRKLDDATATLMAVWEHVPEGLLLVDAVSGTVADANPFAEAILARGRDDIVGIHFASLFAREAHERVAAIFRAGAGSPVQNVAADIAGANGRAIAVEISTSGTFRVEEKTLTLAGVRDVTERKRYERSAARVAETMAAMVRANAAIVRAETADGLLRGVCESVVGGPFCAAWVGAPRHDAVRSAQIIARAGPAQGYLDGITIGWDAGTPAGRGPFGECVRTQLPVAARAGDDAFAYWTERAHRAGIEAVLAVPIADEGRFAALLIYSDDPEGFGADEVALFDSLGGDVVLALRGLRSRDLHVQAEGRERTRAAEVENALEGALAALAATLEKRDPYTAGHERHVAELAARIADELGLDAERKRGLYLASLVHDIGKIAIPAEILTKPTRLTAIEYAFVKQHPDVGYEIMGPIPFPWHIAEIVRQHHEYLDGSGYPRGLRGDEILFEARILTVADIVESMSSFRPYHRPIGLEAALEEVRRLAGGKLDASVVAACARVVERGEFQPSSSVAGP